MALLAVVFAHTALAQSFVQESSFSQVTRRTGGAQYVVTVNKPTNQIYLNLEAELDNPALSSHKLQIHSIKMVSASGSETVLSNQFLSGSDSKISLNLSSSSDITSIVIMAESWRSYHGMYVSIEGQDNSDDRQADEEAQREAEINAEIERRRQLECFSQISSVSRSADRCVSYDLRAVLDDFSRAERIAQRQTRELEQRLAPLNACEKEGTARTAQINSLKTDYSSLTRIFSNVNNDMRNLKAKTIEATGTTFKCTMTRVGTKHRGTYSGEGATKAQALVAAFKTCPNSEKDGCGKESKLRADIQCVKIN